MSLASGDKIYCPHCKAHWVTAVLPVHPHDGKSARPFVYADGTPVNDADEMRCWVMQGVVGG